MLGEHGNCGMDNIAQVGYGVHEGMRIRDSYSSPLLLLSSSTLLLLLYLLSYSSLTRVLLLSYSYSSL